MEVTNIDDFDATVDYEQFLQTNRADPEFYKTIYSKEPDVHTFTRTAVYRTELSESDWKIMRVRDQERRQSEGNVEAGVKGSWGGGNGLELNGYVQGAIRDKNGGYVRGEVTYNTDGVGSVDAAAGYEKRPKGK